MANSTKRIFNKLKLKNKLDGFNIYFFSLDDFIIFECLKRNANVKVFINDNSNNIFNIDDKIEIYDKLIEENFGLKKSIFIKENVKEIQYFREKYGECDLSFCSFDNFEDNIEKVYFISKITREVFYLQIDDKIKPSNIINILQFYNFNQINRFKYNDNISMYIADKKIMIRNNVYQLGDMIIKDYDDTNKFNNMLYCYGKIKDHPNIIKINNNKYLRITMDKYGNNLDSMKISKEQKRIVKKQIIDVVKYMNSKGVLHGDIHTRNICFKNNIIKLVDLDSLFIDTGPLQKSFMLTGNKKNMLNNHHLIESWGYIFIKSKISIREYLKPIKISINDFN